jgi:hypothetical protein
MRQKTSQIFKILLSSLSAFTFTFNIALAGSGFDATKDMAIPKVDLTFTHINPAIQMADAYGDMSKGMHGTFGKFPANFNSGFHTHTGAYHGIVIKGVMINPFKDETNPPEMAAGSYWYVPAGSTHATACVSDEPCEFYFYADSKFDFMPVE